MAAEASSRMPKRSSRSSTGPCRSRPRTAPHVRPRDREVGEERPLLEHHADATPLGGKVDPPLAVSTQVAPANRDPALLANAPQARDPPGGAPGLPGP